MKLSSIFTVIRPGWYRTDAQLRLQLRNADTNPVTIIWERIVPAKMRFKVRESDCVFGQYHTIRAYTDAGWVSVGRV